MKTFLLLIALSVAYVIALAQALPGSVIAQFDDQYELWFYSYDVPREIDDEEIEEVSLTIPNAGNITGHWSELRYDFADEGDLVTFGNLRTSPLTEYYYNYYGGDGTFQLVLLSPYGPVDGEIIYNADGHLYTHPTLVPGEAIHVPEPKTTLLGFAAIAFFLLRKPRNPKPKKS